MKFQIYKTMLLSRYFEEKIQELFNQNLLHGTTHLSIGQEASHTGLSLSLKSGDWIVPTHRCHGYNIARGSDISAMFSEMFGSVYGLCKGLGGSMHMADKKTFNLGSSAVVGSGIPLSLGLSFALKRQKKDNIAVAIFGDGASSRGVLYESLNLASVWNLPTLFYLENNHYGMSANEKKVIATSSIASRASGFNIEYKTIDGNDVNEVLNAVNDAREYIIKNNRPFFLEVSTYRHCGHSKSDNLVYRDRIEEEEWKKKDPIERYKKELNEKDIVRLEKEAKDEIEKAYKKAFETKDEILPLEEAEELSISTYITKDNIIGDTHKATYKEAISEALSVLLKDEKVSLIGEDIGLYGGCFGVTKDLYKKYEKQIFETPVSEEAFTGLAVGASILGEFPIVEVMYGDFSTLASDAIINHAAKTKFISGGQFESPFIFRTPMGGGTGHASQHTQNLENMFLNTSGLIVLAPSDAYSAKAMLLSARNANNPVLFLENKALYNTIGEVGNDEETLEIGKARVLREGKDILIISYSAATERVKEAIKDKNDITHLDLLTISPLDYKTIERYAILAKKVIIVQDTAYDSSVGASIAGFLAQKENLKNMDIKVLSAKNIPLPFSKTLESSIYPTRKDILKAL